MSSAITFTKHVAVTEAYCNSDLAGYLDTRNHYRLCVQNLWSTEFQQQAYSRCPSVHGQQSAEVASYNPLWQFQFLKHTEEMHHIARQNVAHKAVRIDHNSTDMTIADCKINWCKAASTSKFVARCKDIIVA